MNFCEKHQNLAKCQMILEITMTELQKMKPINNYPNFVCFFVELKHTIKCCLTLPEVIFLKQEDGCNYEKYIVCQKQFEIQDNENRFYMQLFSMFYHTM
jgi:hypothetical protein